jgi:colanic acid/amylovoran biosynthesis glycosyltransferase
LTARDPDHGRSMHIAYLVNQYPKVSHTFIRREINALEARGVQVTRLAIRPSPDRLIDPADLAEVRQTRCILGAGPLQFAQALVAVLLQQPLGMLTAMRAAWSMGRRSERALLKHAAYLLEACVLRLWLRSQDIDHVHVHFGTNSAAVALLSHLMGGGDYSLTVHGPEEFDMPSALALEDKIRHARFVVAISSFCRSQLYRWTPPDQCPGERVLCGRSVRAARSGPPGLHRTIEPGERADPVVAGHRGPSSTRCRCAPDSGR